MIINLKDKDKEVTVEPLSVTENGTYTAPTGKAYSPVTVNVGEPFPPVIKRVTGNPIEITDAASAPLVKCVTEITGSQDLHGYDKPWVGGAGKNKFDEEYSTNYSNVVQFPAGTYYFQGFISDTSRVNTRIQYSADGENWTTIGNTPYSESGISMTGWSGGYQSNAGVFTATITTTVTLYFRLYKVNGPSSLTNRHLSLSTTELTSWEPYSNICPITAYTEGEIEVRGRNLWSLGDLTVATDAGISFALKSGTYTFQAVSNTNVDGITIRFNYEDSTSDVITIYRPDFSGKSLTLSKNVTTINYNIPNFTTGTIISKIQIERGDTAHAYEEYITPIDHTTTYPTAIYRGSEDCVNGEVSYDMPVVDLGNLTWRMSDSTQGGFITDLTNYKFENTVQAVCSAYNYVGTNQTGTSVLNNGEIAFYYRGGAGITLRQLYIRDTRFSTLSDFEAAISGVQFAYELSASQTASVTPTNLPIKSLSGYSHIESSTGEMEIDYITDAYQNFVDTTESALPNTRKGGSKAMDIFMTLDNPSSPDDEKVDKSVDETSKK